VELGGTEERGAISVFPDGKLGNAPFGSCEEIKIRDFTGIGVQGFLL
jgi:hypothetical protein